MSRADILKELNRELPDYDWKTGARDYLRGYFDKYDRASVEHISFVKPLMPVTPEDPVGSLDECFAYLSNFANAIKLFRLPRGARVLDVACGGGWVSHWLIRLGYNVYGIDISNDFIELARKRVAVDPHLGPVAGKAEFEVLDVESSPLPTERHGTFDAAILESCLHHFFDPITALGHISAGLKDSGVVLIIEGENRQGPIRDEYWRVMHETKTLERPYSREMLTRILHEAGLPHVSFLGSVEGYISEDDPRAPHLAQYFVDVLNSRNTCLAGKNAAALQRVLPHYGKLGVDQPAPTTPTPPPALRYPWIPTALRPVLRALKRRFI